MNKEVMKQALDAFEAIMMARDIDSATTIAKNARYGLREALKQEQGEPVGWIDNKGNMICIKINESCKPLYTTPQGCDECGVGGGYAFYCVACAEKFFGNKEWVGLTRMELIKCGVLPFGMSYKLYQAIEAKLKEKNGY